MGLLIHKQYDLIHENTFGFSCIAQYFVRLTQLDELSELFAHNIYRHAPQKIILGGGSNMLFATETIDALVIKNECTGKTILEETDSHVIIEIGAGEIRDDIVWRMLSQGRGGYENLVSIPGTVGAAPVQNIGAYGVELQDHLLMVRGVDFRTQRTHTFDKTSCRFSYRDSVFKSVLKESFLITSVVFKLQKYDPSTYLEHLEYEGITDRIDQISKKETTLSRLELIATAIAQIRSQKLPDRKTVGTAGSFFKNPYIEQKEYDTLQQQYPTLKGRPVATDSTQVKLSAGQLIELAGYKGYSNNGVGVYEHHALVLVNHSATSGTHLLALVQDIQETITKQFGVTIEPEVRIIS